MSKRDFLFPLWGKRGMTYLYLGYTVTRWVPWLVTIIISAASIGRSADGSWRWGKEFILVVYNMWLCIMQLVLYIIQYGFNITQTDPYDLETLIYTFPSAETFYMFSMLTYFLGFTFLWQVQIEWLPYAVMFFCCLVVPSMMYQFRLNTPAELAASAVMGICGTLLFLVFMRFVVVKNLPFIIHQRPWTWFSCIDSHMMNQEEQDESVRIKRALVRMYPEGPL